MKLQIMKSIIMGNGPLPLSLRPSTVQKFKRNFHYSGGKHQDTMRAPARAVRRDQIEKRIVVVGMTAQIIICQLKIIY